MIGRLRAVGRVHVSAVYDVDRAKRHGAATHYDADRDLRRPEDVIEAADIVLVLTSMNEHGRRRKPRSRPAGTCSPRSRWPPSLREAAELELAESGPGVLVCALHTLQPDVPRRSRCRPGGRGRRPPGTARARYGWQAHGGTSGSTLGGGSLFDLGVYNVTSLCALFGPARRVTAMVGVAILEREVTAAGSGSRPTTTRTYSSTSGTPIRVVTTGFTMQRYRSPRSSGHGARARCSSSATTGRLGGVGAVAERETASRAHLPESDPHWQWTEGAAPSSNASRADGQP